MTYRSVTSAPEAALAPLRPRSSCRARPRATRSNPHMQGHACRYFSPSLRVGVVLPPSAPPLGGSNPDSGIGGPAPFVEAFPLSLEITSWTLVESLGLEVLGFWVWGLGFGVWYLEVGVRSQGLGFRI